MKNRSYSLEMLDPALAAGARAREKVFLAYNVAFAVRSEETAEAVEGRNVGGFGE